MKILLPIVALFALITCVCQGAELAEVAALRQQFEAQTATADQEAAQKLTAAQRVYLEGVDAIQRQLAANGDLDGVLAARAERDRVTAGTALEANKRKSLPLPIQRELVRYEQTVVPLTQTRSLAAHKAREQYATGLLQLQKQFTKANEIEKAVAVRQTREQIETEANSGGAVIAPATPLPLANPVVLGSYYDRLSNSLRGPKKTKVIGSRNKGTEFTALPSEGAHLVGVAIKKGDWFGSPIIASLQPIFEGRTGRLRGAVLGKPADSLPLVCESKPGYVVSELLVSAPGDHVHGIKLIFRKLDILRQSLLPNDSYESDWLVLELDKKSERVGDPTHPAIGFTGRAGDWVAALGLLQAP